MDDMNRSGFTPNEEWHPDTLADRIGTLAFLQCGVSRDGSSDWFGLR